MELVRFLKWASGGGDGFLISGGFFDGLGGKGCEGFGRLRECWDEGCSK